MPVEPFLCCCCCCCFVSQCLSIRLQTTSFARDKIAFLLKSYWPLKPEAHTQNKFKATENSVQVNCKLLIHAKQINAPNARGVSKCAPAPVIPSKCTNAGRVPPFAIQFQILALQDQPTNKHDSRCVRHNIH